MVPIPVEVAQRSHFDLERVTTFAIAIFGRQLSEGGRAVDQRPAEGLDESEAKVGTLDQRVVDGSDGTRGDGKGGVVRGHVNLLKDRIKRCELRAVGLA